MQTAGVQSAMVIRRVGGLEGRERGLDRLRNVIRRVGGLEVFNHKFLC